MLEFLYLPRFNKELINKKVIVHNRDFAEDAINKTGGIIFVSGHISNWEMMAFSFPFLFDNKLNVITKIQASKGLNEEINKYRTLSGNEMIEIGFSLKKIFKKLMGNESIGFLVDQSAHPDYSIYIDFFGQKTAAFSGPAKIFLKQRPELLLGYLIRQENYSYVFTFEKINCADLTAYTEENVIDLTQRIQSEIENVVRINPGQWLWFHKRFKHMKS